jgi:hypothetical protein
MTARFAVMCLAIAVVCSAVMMWAGVNDRSFNATAWSAAAFALVAALVGWQLNRQDPPLPTGDDGAMRLQLQALRHNGQLSTLVYAWGAAAMAAMYKLTDLYWQHALQYAAGMLLFAAVIFGWTHLARPGGPMATAPWLARAARLNLLHGATAAVAVIVFLISGKLWAAKPDWAANIVFTAGGFAIVTLCTMAALTHARLGRTA